MPTIKEYIIGDLGPARRHFERIWRGKLLPTPAVLREISASIERCVDRIEKSLHDEELADPAVPQER